MKERQQRYDSYSQFDAIHGKRPIRKLVVVEDHFERGQAWRAIRESLERSCEKGRISFIGYEKGYDFRVCVYGDPDYSFAIDIHNCKFNWAGKVRGYHYDEVISYGRGKEEFLRSRQNIADMVKCVEGSNDPFKGSLLFRLVAKEDLWTQFDYNRGKSWLLDFPFPASLYRVGMEDFFEDSSKPTIEEFLMALTMENVNATTPEEIEAVKKAELYIQSKGY